MGVKFIEEKEQTKKQRVKFVGKEDEQKETGLLSRVGEAAKAGVRTAKEFARSTIESPLETGAFVARGALEGIRSVPDIPGLLVARGLAAATGESQEDITKLTQLEKERRLRDLPPEEERTEQQKRSLSVGEFAGRTGAGLALGAGAGLGTQTLGRTLATGAIANIPQTGKILEEQDLGSAALDVGINTAIDLLTLGSAKAFPQIKRAILNQFKNIGDAEASRLAKEAFKQAKALPTGKQVAKGTGLEEVAGLRLQETAAPPKTLREKTPGIGTRLVEGDRSILSEPLKETDTPFSRFAEVAQKAKENPRNPTPMDIAGTRAKEALDDLSKKRKDLGKQIGDALQEAPEGATIDMTDAKINFVELINDRLSATFDDTGKIIPLQGDIIPDAAGESLAEEMFQLINSVPDQMTPKAANNLKRRLQALTNKFKASQTKEISTVTEGIGKEIESEINDEIGKVLGKGFQDLNDEFSRVATNQEFLNRKLGQEIAKGSGITTQGASLLKSALQSNSDRGTKTAFREIMDLTGIDLIKEAKFAEIAMRKVGDPRIKGLLDELSKLGIGPKSQVLSVGGKVAGKFRQTELEEAVDFFRKQQKRVAKGRLKEVKKKQKQFRTLGSGL